MSIQHVRSFVYIVVQKYLDGKSSYMKLIVFEGNSKKNFLTIITFFIIKTHVINIAAIGTGNS